jgi:hypothetical protein
MPRPCATTTHLALYDCAHSIIALRSIVLVYRATQMFFCFGCNLINSTHHSWCLFAILLGQGKFIRVHFSNQGKIAGADIESCKSHVH